MGESMAELIARDRRLLWHPYSQHGSLNDTVLPVVRARGARITLREGDREREVIDAISSWWVNIHGHGEPAIADAIHRQALEMEHVIFAGFTHEPAVALAERLIDDLGAKGQALSRVFYSDNGSTAVEVALKMAFQYHYNRGEKQRTRFIALRGSYHGDTLGAMAIGDPGGFHTLFQPLLPEVDFVAPGDMEALIRLLDERPGRHAAFVFEPMIQGASGMRLVPPAFLDSAGALCAKHGILNIADEVFTGFFRTGRGFAIEHLTLKPDLLCLSKGITGGFLPLAATLATEAVYAAFLDPALARAFLHGHSYTANPIACAAALASWKLLQEPPRLARIAAIGAKTAAWIERLAAHPRVANARSLGTIGAIDLRLENGTGYFAPDRSRLLTAALARGVLLRPLGNVLYSVPPYCISDDELDLVYETMEALADECR
jgi:adenosylmethionine-8-amino-7-oxononanoate aminotransferase